MGDFFYLLLSPEHEITIFLYTFIFITSSFLGFKCQKQEWYGTKYISNKIFICLFIFLCVFYAFNDVGVDTPHYRHYFDIYKDIDSIDNGYGSVEKLYQILNILLHYIFTDSYWAVAFIRVLQLGLFFYAIYLLRDKTIIGFSIMAYVALFYFDSFNLLRSSLSGSLSLLSFAYLYQNRYIPMIVTTLLSVGFHTSALLLVLAIVIYCICYETPLKKLHKIIPVAATLALFSLLAVGGDYINVLLADDFGGGRYEDYKASSNGIGVFILLKYLPTFVFFYLLKKIHSDFNKWMNINFVWLMMGFGIALLAYQIGILGRVAIYFSPPFIFLMPYYCIITQQSSVQNRASVRLLFIFFYAFLFVSTLGGLYVISEIGPFKFI